MNTISLDEDYYEEMKEENHKMTDQLTKAKEIIKELLLLPYANNEEVYADVTSTLDKAEQFLKGEDIILEDAQAGNSPFDADEVFNKEMKAYSEEK